MTSVSVTSVGPFQALEDGDIYAVFALADGHALSAVELTKSAAVDQLRRQLPRGAQVRCDSSLADLAQKYGWVVAPSEPEVIELAALAVVGISHGELMRKLPSIELQRDLLTAAVEFARCRPWDRFEGDELIDVTLTGDSPGSRVGAVFGQNDEEFGLTLFATTQQAIQFMGSVDNPAQAMRVEQLTCLTSLESSGVAEVVNRAFGVPTAPRYLHMRNGSPQALRADDARTLVACLRAFTAVARTGTVGTGTCQALGKTVTAEIRCSLPDVEPIETMAPTVARHSFHVDDAVNLPRVIQFARSAGWQLPEEGLSHNLEVAFALFGQDPTPSWAQRWFEATAGEGIAGAERWLRLQQSGRLMLLEVLAVRPGVVAARDRLLGTSLLLHDVGISGSARRGQAVLGWVLQAEGQYVLAGAHLQVFAPDAQTAVVTALQKNCGELSEAKLRQADLGPAVMAAATAPVPTPGRPKNTDGHVVVFSTDRFTLKGKPNDVRTLLDALPDCTSDNDDAYSFTQLGNRMHPLWWRTVIGSLELKRNELTLSANSTERLDSLRHLVTSTLGDAVTFIERTTEGMPLPAIEMTIDAQPLEHGPWVEVMSGLEMVASLQASDGASLAGADAALRAKALGSVAASLAAFEANEPGLALSARRAVGVSSGGEFVGRDEVWLAMGAGLPMSLALQVLIAPALSDFKGPMKKRLTDAARLAWAAWNVRLMQAPLTARVTQALEVLKPVGKATREKNGLLEQRLPASSAAVYELAPRLLPWLIRRAETLFATDGRLIGGVGIRQEPGNLGLHVMWAMNESWSQRLREEYGYASNNDRALNTYAERQAQQPFGWAVTPAPWRRELIVDWLASSNAPLTADFDSMVDRRLAFEEALHADRNGHLRRAVDALCSMGLSHIAAVGRLMAINVSAPDSASLLQKTVDGVRQAMRTQH